MIINPNISEIELTSEIGFDLETTGLEAWNDEIDLVAITNSNGKKYVLEWARYSPEDKKSLCVRMSELGKVVAHNAKFDSNFIYFYTGVLLRNIHCTQVTANIIENGYQKQRDFDLVSLLGRYLNVSHSYSEKKKRLQKSFTDPALRAALSTLPQIRLMQLEYAAEDTVHLLNLYHSQMEFIYQDGLEKIYKLEHKLMPVLVKMECRGCPIDAKLWSHLVKTVWEPKLLALEKQLDTEITRLLKGKKTSFNFNRKKAVSTTFDIFGGQVDTQIESERAINYASSPQLLELFPVFNEPIPTNSDGEPSVDETTLSTYTTEHPESQLGELIRILLLYREYAKLISTYGDSFLAKLDKNGCIHTLYTQTQTETGRLSSKTPNLQNIPAPDKKNPDTDIRRCFIAPPGYKFITCDMDAAEVRIAADFSGDQLLIDSLEKGFDMHSKLGSVTYSIIFDEETIISKSEDAVVWGGKSYIPDTLRTDHKTGLFAKFYKAGAKRMYIVFAEYINAHWPPKKRKKIAQEISDAIDKELPQLSVYLDGLIKTAQRTGKLIGNALGRIRYFRDTVYGEAANYPIQETCADAQKIALIKTDEYLDTIGGWLVLNVHDEGCSIVPDKHVDEAMIKIKDITASSLGWFLKRIKGGASIKAAQHWKK